MHLRIDIECDNAESNGEIQDQITDTLNEIARRIGRLKPSAAPWPLFDSNGNTVGRVTVSESASEPDRLREALQLFLAFADKADVANLGGEHANRLPTSDWVDFYYAARAARAALREQASESEVKL